MSLKLWLPLDNNMNNFGTGLSNPIITTTPTYVSGGKTGGVAMSQGACKWSAAQAKKVLNNNELTIAFWIKALNTTSGQIFGTSGMGENNNRKFAVFAYPNGNDLHLSWMNDVASKTFVGGVWSNVFPTNTWTHCCITYKNPTVTIYINGQVIGSTSGVSASSSFEYDTQIIHNSANRHLSDFRVYNHCLSPREVKLLSQGLILHLPLKDDAVEETANLVPYPSPGSSAVTTYGWDQSLHPNAISVSGWTAGYNGGVSSPETGYHAYWNIIDGLPTIVFPRFASRWLGVSGASGIQKQIGANTTYTISFDAKASVENMVVQTGFYYRLTGSTSNNFHDGKKDFSLGTSWKRYSVTFTTKANIDTGVAGSIYFYGYTGSVNGYAYVRNIQVELKDHPTAYTRSIRKPKIMDCSGYNRNGAIVGQLYTKNDSARYSNATYFTDGRTNYGKSGVFTMPTDKVTMSCWIKGKVAGQGGYHIPVSFNAADYEMSIDSSGCFRNGFTVGGSRVVLTTSHASILDDKWHMITATYDGTTIRRYVDGTELTSYATAATGALSGKTASLLIGNYNTTTYGNKELSMSDVRVYSTALSAEDIKLLYDSRASFLNNGAVAAYEFYEDARTKLQFGENGIIHSSGFSDLTHIADMPLKVLPDGSAWARIHWLNVTNELTWFTTDEVQYCTNKTNRYSRMAFVDKFKDPDGYYEFMLTYPSGLAGYNRWKQTSSPNATAVTGFTAITTKWSAHNSGLRKHGSACVYNCDSGTSWYAPIGQLQQWTTGKYIPAADGSSQTETELWVRIDKLTQLNKFSMLENKFIQAPYIYEL